MIIYVSKHNDSSMVKDVLPVILGSQLKNAMISGSNNISRYKKQVNDLNIFPVPDGDTGTNMSMTIGAAADELKKLPDSAPASEVAKVAASSMLRGARGNSGVILSLLFRGFSKGLAGKTEVDSEDIVNALEIGVEEAYKAVMKPTEGTMLTVARVAAERAREALELDSDPVQIWDAVCIGAAEALEETPELLPVLKKAGVVDAGGQGVCLIFEGMLSVFRSGVILESGLTEEEKAEETAEFFRNVAAEFDSEITFTYCTEFIVGRDPEIEKDPLDLRLFLETIGDCVVVVDDEEIIKTHVHTENPGDALQAALQYGQLLTVKIENMKEQHRKAAEENEAAKAAAGILDIPEPSRLEPQEPTEEMGFVSVAAGEGLKGLFLDLGCSTVVSGGQTMNPSTEDILNAVDKINAEHIFILPNNKNIILAAEQAAKLSEEKKLHVIPSRSVPEGISAMFCYEHDADPDEMEAAMKDAIQQVDTATVTYAVRDTSIGDKQIKEGNILGMLNDEIEVVAEDVMEGTKELLRNAITEESEVVSIYYGADTAEEDAKELSAFIEEEFPDCEVEVQDGGQPLYYYIISIE